MDPITKTIFFMRCFFTESADCQIIMDELESIDDDAYRSGIQFVKTQILLWPKNMEPSLYLPWSIMRIGCLLSMMVGVTLFPFTLIFNKYFTFFLLYECGCMIGFIHYGKLLHSFMPALF